MTKGDLFWTWLAILIASALYYPIGLYFFGSDAGVAIDRLYFACAGAWLMWLRSRDTAKHPVDDYPYGDPPSSWRGTQGRK